MNGNDRLLVMRSLQNSLSLSEQNGTIFNEEKFSFFLAFDYLFITELTEFQKLLCREAETLFLGFLPSIGLGQGAVDEQYTWFRLEPSSSASELKRVFEYDPKLPDNSSIQTYIRNGYVMPKSASWVIWFSTYWEVAIAGFQNMEELLSFRNSNDWISYYRDDQFDIMNLNKNAMTRRISGNVILE